ncbi:unnamed protein product [marine sediment metagenome]|uniref:Uncharacterized protein n=1 Tax=marine sediment metagenome TaxID=412755 RepID=X1LVM5_9ZZZZ
MKRKYFFVILFLVLAIFLSSCNGGEKKETEPEAKQPAEQKQQLSERPLSSLTITDVNVSDGEVTISGNTDLPNSATLIVDFNTTLSNIEISPLPLTLLSFSFQNSGSLFSVSILISSCCEGSSEL